MGLISWSSCSEPVVTAGSVMEAAFGLKSVLHHHLKYESEKRAIEEGETRDSIYYNTTGAPENVCKPSPSTIVSDVSINNFFLSQSTIKRNDEQFLYNKIKFDKIRQQLTEMKMFSCLTYQCYKHSFQSGNYYFFFFGLS